MHHLQASYRYGLLSVNYKLFPESLWEMLLLPDLIEDYSYKVQIHFGQGYLEQLQTGSSRGHQDLRLK
jgi:hypothetical protein